MINIHNVHPVVPLLKHNRHCKVHAGADKKYAKYAGHIFCDRIDIQCEISPVGFTDLSKMQPGESSVEIRKRVIAARNIQTVRYKDYYTKNPGAFAKGANGGGGLVHCNAQMTDKMLHEYCVLDNETNKTLQDAMERFSLSARAYSRILKVARTIADLSGSANIQISHIAEAVSYRNLDRGDWCERV